MAGVIKAVNVKEGDHVDPGTVLVVLEAMKMDNMITASAAGKVTSVNVAEGESVIEGHVLLSLE